MADNDTSPAPPQDNVDETSDKWHRLQEFQYHHRHSLRISVSNIAAMTGFHPFRSLPEVLMKLVYQGSTGQALLKHDAALLQLEMIDEETILMDLARKASVETSQTLQLALQVKMGTAKLDTIQKAHDIKQRIVQEATKTQKLTKEELKLLQEGARSAIDTGYGTFHEDSALDLYELKCGWTVRDRNAEILMWPFQRTEDFKKTNLPEESYADVGAQLTATAVPLRSPLPCWKRSVDTEPVNADEFSRESKRSKPLAANEVGSHDPIEIKDGGNQDDESPPAVEDGEPVLKVKDESLPTPPPFFYILGSVDGIREEMFPVVPNSPPSLVSATPSDIDNGEDDDNWLIRDVIVECKHRMNKIHPTPPLYEQIQTTAYCLMYQVTEADIIQVIRKDKPKQRKRTQQQPQLDPAQQERPNNDDKNKLEESSSPGRKPQSTILNYFSPKRDEKTETIQATAISNPNDDATSSVTASASGQADLEQHEQDEEPERAEVEIAVSRVSIDEPLYQHRINWDKVVLPRLCWFVDAVYRIRACDEKRYRLLMAMASSTSSSLLDAWNLLHEECPWLQSCDTAFGREVGLGFGKIP